MAYLCGVYHWCVMGASRTYSLNVTCRMVVLFAILHVTCIVGAWAVSPPPSKPVHIEVRHPWSRGRLMYFWLTDLYTKEERKVRSEARREGVAVLDFKLYHPLYAEIIPSGNQSIPFYVEPGDTLIIRVGKNGRVEAYERPDGQPVKMERLLRHDVSNRSFYTAEDFAEDKRQGRFPDFVERMKGKMTVALDSVERVADRYGFSEEERCLARCNVQMQFALWLFEYAPMKSSELLAYANHHEGGWQSLPKQDAEVEALRDLRNYGFLSDLPLNDSTLFASQFFPAFIQSYEHAPVFNYDQYLYAGTSLDDMARMDSAFVAKELAITHDVRPSLVMDMAVARRHMEAVPEEDDGSIRLQEVEVMGASLDNFYRVFGRSEYNPQEVVEKAWGHDVNLKGPISSLFNRKKIKRYKRAKKLVKQYGADDAEREALMKAWENTMKKE